jgi:hypothetical protein
MAAPYNDLLSKLEAALKSLVDALALTGTRGSTANVAVGVLTGLDDDAVSLPKIVCHAEDTTEEVVRHTGNFRVRCHLHIYSHSADETLAVHRNRVARVIDAIHMDNIAAQLSAAVADFYVFDAHFMGPSADPEGNAFHTDLEFTVVCCASDL